MEKLPEINIIYEDNHLIVVEKPCNEPVCPDESGDESLYDKIRLYLKIKYNKKGEAYLGILHRLDRVVGGVMVFAKTSKCASRLSKQISEHSISKIYYAVTQGKIESKGRLIDYLYKDKKTNMVYVTNKNKGKLAICDYEVIKSYHDYSLVKIDLKTGRSHQIRVQFSSRGCPLVCDYRYNKNNQYKEPIALFAKSISFNHPTSGERLTFSLELPKRYPFNLF